MALAARGEAIPESLNGITVSRAELRAITARVLAAETFRERASVPGVDPRRADILAAGCVVLETILEDCGFDEYTISSYALREGIVLDTIKEEQRHLQGLAHLSDLRYESVKKIGRMYNFDEAHGRHVADLALMMYEGLRPLHRLPDDSRELLEAASLLHDIGYYISHSAHHKHSMYLIQNTEAFGFNLEEMTVIANIARYHRKSHPKKQHPEFNALRRSDQQCVRHLAAILRIADGLDRTHKGNVEMIETSFDDATITLKITCRDGVDPTFETWSATRKKGLMEEVLGREVIVATQQEVLA